MVFNSLEYDALWCYCQIVATHSAIRNVMIVMIMLKVGLKCNISTVCGQVFYHPNNALPAGHHKRQKERGHKKCDFVCQIRLKKTEKI